MLRRTKELMSLGEVVRGGTARGVACYDKPKGPLQRREAKSRGIKTQSQC